MPRLATGQIIEKRTRGGVTYGLRVPYDGRRPYITLGATADGMTRRQAEDEAATIMAAVRAGRWRPRPAAAPEVQLDPTFHVFASEWFAGKQEEIRPNTVRSYRNDLTHHLLPFFAEHRLSEITIVEVDRYRNAKVREGRLGARSINMTLSLLAQILEVAADYGHIERNTASGRRRRLKAARPRPVHLDTAEHISALLEAAGQLDADPTMRTDGRRPCVATLVFAGLRADELRALCWRHVDLANGRLQIGVSKTSAGLRDVDLLPVLRDELAGHKAACSAAGRIAPDDPVFVTTSGRPRDRYNLRQHVVLPVVALADDLLIARGENPLPEGLSPHKLRHSFASLLVALGNDPSYVMGQLGHTDPAFTLRVYSHMMRREEGARERLKALVNGTYRAPTGTNSPADGVLEPSRRRL